MSLFDNARDMRRRGTLCLATAALSLALTGCQVRPLYSDGPGGFTAKALAAIEISDATDRVGQEVRNHLVFLVGGGAGEPASPEYRLALAVTHQEIGVLYDKRNDRDMAAAGRIVVKADYNLTRADTGTTVRSGNRSAVALVDYSVQEFSKIRAIRDAENRASRELAEIIRADLSAALGNPPTTPGTITK